jgi:structural maintenance of chromosome 2
MHIKEVVLDGFKSYANRTVVSGFDPAFNAITGLNGSGKSNILDSICFVLGISNLSQVRVSNLQELVYKQGQSRVTKASVTIVFDNSEKKTSPVGYEQYDEITVTRQVVIGGRNKYLINGHNAQLARVHNLFHSVQLNVNNPHFLIMQGRITKVCNMKPPEVLAMIEEAAGTRMYETKKSSALKTIARKQVKVDEINKILVEEINPTLERLKKERSSYLTWSSNKEEMKRLQRFVTAATYKGYKDTVDQSQDRVEEAQQTQENLKSDAAEIKEHVKQYDSNISALAKEKQNQMASAFSSLEQQVGEHSKELVKQTSMWQHKKDNVDAERTTLQETEASLMEAQQAVTDKEAEIKEADAKAHENQSRYDQLSHRVSTLQSQQLGIRMSDDDKEQKGTLANQLMEAQRGVTEADSEVESLAIKVKHLQTELKKKRSTAKSAEKQYNKLQKNLASKQADLDSIESKLNGMNFDESAVSRSQDQIAELKEKIATMREQYESLQAKLVHFNFDYEAPRSFDRSKVKGLVAKLIELKSTDHATAIEITAGGRLYNVVVDTQSTGSALLSKCKLKRRVTIIPLNKIARRSINEARIAAAKKLVGDDNADLALSLVGYDDEVAAAMEYVFGNTIVCRTSDDAKRVTFHKDIKARTVTYNGDSFDPAGTLTGGAQTSNGSMLLKLERLAKLQAKLDEAEQQMADLEAQLKQARDSEAAARELTVQKELCCHEIALMNTRISQSTFAQHQQDSDAIDQKISECKEQRKAAQQRSRDSKKHAAELERMITDFESERKNKAKEIEKEIASSKKELASLQSTVKSTGQHHEKLTMELQQLQEEVQSIQSSIAQLKAKIAKLTEEADALEANVVACKEVYESANGKLSDERKKMAATDKKISQLEKKREQLQSRLTTISIDLKKSQHRIVTLHADEKTARTKVAALLKQHPWIKDEEHLIGKPHTDYDFQRTKPAQAQKRLAHLQSQQDDLERSVNKKVMGMFDKVKDEYDELVEKRDIISKDKSKIEQVIEELDRKKNEALETTWRKVNKDFGSIFSTLLPGASAKLEPPEGKTVLDGLEVCVSFGGVWKQSLSELSGGQRSLLALSLILAMLLFKPAPMYILDEIDAALDLSHTQNIGQMLKTHFPQSQFIVVSLKEGMFNNANVVFRTKFVDGVSTVARTQLRLGKK